MVGTQNFSHIIVACYKTDENAKTNTNYLNEDTKIKAFKNEAFRGKKNESRGCFRDSWNVARRLIYFVDYLMDYKADFRPVAVFPLIAFHYVLSALFSFIITMRITMIHEV